MKYDFKDSEPNIAVWCVGWGEGGGVNKRKEEYLLNIDLYCYHFEIIT